MTARERLPNRRAGNMTRALDYREFLLAELKCAALRSRLVTAEIDSIGVALRGDFITEDEAIAWLHECGGLQFLSAPKQSETAA